MDEPEQREMDARLAGRLLRAGIGPRHVGRTLRELRDHRADLVERMMAQGSDRHTAVQEAQKRLGDERSLIAQMAARPELRSRARRFAWLLFIIGPPVMVIAVGGAAIFAALTIMSIPGAADLF